MTHTPAAASSFSSGRAYRSLHFLPPLSSLDLLSDYVGVTISLNNSSSLSFLNIYAPPIRFSSTDSRTGSTLSVISPRNLFILGDFNFPLFLRDSKGSSDLRREEAFDSVISSDYLSLNDSDTLLFSVAPFLTSSFLFLQLGHASEFGFNRFPILLTVPFLRSSA